MAALSSARSGQSGSAKSPCNCSRLNGLPAASSAASTICASFSISIAGSSVLLAGMRLRVAGRSRTFGIARLDMDRSKGLSLDDVQQGFSNQFQDRKKSDDHTHAALLWREQRVELDELPALYPGKHIRHALAHGQGLALYMVMGEHVGSREHFLEAQQQFAQGDVGKNLDHLPFAHLRARLERVPFKARQPVDLLRGLLEALVFLEPANQFSARVLALLFLCSRARQEHARLDLGKHGCHHEVLGRKLELQLLHDLDVLHVLLRNPGDRNVEDVDVLPLYEVQQEIERPFEGIQDDLECMGRNVQVDRQLDQRLAFDDRKRHFCLTGSHRLVLRLLSRSGCLVRRHNRRFLAHRYSNPMASRTSSMVSLAASRARSRPSEIIMSTVPGLAVNSMMRSRIGCNSLSTASITGCLHSTQPIPALRQPSCTQVCTASSE